jgi:epoxyqueuosine reductase
LHRATGDWLFGCDVCQEVCPHNHHPRRSEPLPVLEDYAPRRGGFDLLEVLDWTESDRREAFITSSMKRAKLEMFRRNAVICAGNALATREEPELHRRLQEISLDPSESDMIRMTACEVLEDLDASESS